MSGEQDPGPLSFSATELGLATLLFALLTIVLAYPISLHPASLRVDMGLDGDLGWYILSWDAHAFLHHPWAIFDASIYYPDRFTLAYGENIIGLAFFAAPVIWLTGNSALATTLVSLLSCILCGLGAYVLARRVGLSVAAAVICGIIFECAPPRFFRIGQITLTNIQWIPFALASAHAYFDTGRKWHLRVTAGFVSLQVLSSGHGAVFVTLTLLLFGLYRLLLGEPWLPAKRIRDLGVTGALLLLPSVLIFLPYRYVQTVMGLKRGLGSWDTEAVSFLASPSHFHVWLYKALGATRVLASEVTLFPGFLAIGLALVALAWRRRRPMSSAEGVRRRSEQVDVVLGAGVVLSATISAVLTVTTIFHLRFGSLWLEAPRAASLASTLFPAMLLLAVIWRRRLPVQDVTFVRWPLVTVAVAMLAAAAITLARPTAGAGDGLLGEYFSTTDWSGAPAVTAVDTHFARAWMTRRWGGVEPEQFSVRWQGFVTVPRAGIYTFFVTSDDGSYITIDGAATPLVDNGGSHSAQTRTGQIGLGAGAHEIDVRYMQAGADAALDIEWSRNGARPTTIPAWALSTQRPTVNQAFAVRIMDAALAGLAVIAALAALVALVSWASGPAKGVLAAQARACRTSPTVFYGLFTLLTLGLALGPPYGLWQYVYWMPGFNFIRASSRFSLLTLLGLSVLAALGFERMTSAWTARKRNIASALVAVGLLIEYAAVPIGFTQTHFEIPAIDRWLDGQPKPFVIAEVPIRSEQDQVDYMNHSTAHWQKTVQGYDGWRREFHTDLYAALAGFPDERSIERLNEIGVTYVVVHQERFTPEQWAGVEERLRSYASRLRLEHTEGEGRVYSVVR